MHIKIFGWVIFNVGEKRLCGNLKFNISNHLQCNWLLSSFGYISFLRPCMHYCPILNYKLFCELGMCFIVETVYSDQFNMLNRLLFIFFFRSLQTYLHPLLRIGHQKSENGSSIESNTAENIWKTNYIEWSWCWDFDKDL